MRRLYGGESGRQSRPIFVRDVPSGNGRDGQNIGLLDLHCRSVVFVDSVDSGVDVCVWSSCVGLLFVLVFWYPLSLVYFCGVRFVATVVLTRVLLCLCIFPLSPQVNFHEI